MPMPGKLHEILETRDQVAPGSERGFGIVFAVVFAIIGLWPLWAGTGVRIWSLAIASVFLVAALATPWVPAR